VTRRPTTPSPGATIPRRTPSRCGSTTSCGCACSERHHAARCTSASIAERAHLGRRLPVGAPPTPESTPGARRRGARAVPARRRLARRPLLARRADRRACGCTTCRGPEAAPRSATGSARRRRAGPPDARAARAAPPLLRGARPRPRVDRRRPAQRALARPWRRLGYESEAVLRNAYPAPDGRPGHLAFYGLLREEWEARRRRRPAPPLPLPRFALRVDDELQLGLLERADVPALAALVEPTASTCCPGCRGLGPLGGRHARLRRGAGAPRDRAGRRLRGRDLVARPARRRVRLHTLYREPLRGSLGYWLAADAQGHGIATRAVRAVRPRPSTTSASSASTCAPTSTNARSRAVAERLGFTFEGRAAARTPAAGRRWPSTDCACRGPARLRPPAPAGSSAIP
jgi:RimJ/RimL family protein N-acetyltransferase